MTARFLSLYKSYCTSAAGCTRQFQGVCRCGFHLVIDVAFRIVFVVCFRSVSIYLGKICHAGLKETERNAEFACVLVCYRSKVPVF